MTFEIVKQKGRGWFAVFNTEGEQLGDPDGNPLRFDSYEDAADFVNTLHDLEQSGKIKNERKGKNGKSFSKSYACN